MLIIMIALACVSSTRASESCDIVDVSFAENWLPISYYTDDGSPDGVVVRLHRQIFEELGVRSHFIGNIPWKRQLAMLEAGEMDAIAAINYTSERDQTYLLSDPIHHFKVRVFGKSGSHLKVSGVEDLGQYKVAYSRGASYGPAFDDVAARSEGFMQINGTDKIVELVVLDRVDLIVLPERLGLALINKAGAGDKVAVIGEPIHSQSVHLAFSRKSPCAALMTDYNTVLKKLYDIGFVEENRAMN